MDGLDGWVGWMSWMDGLDGWMGRWVLGGGLCGHFQRRGREGVEREDGWTHYHVGMLAVWLKKGKALYGAAVDAFGALICLWWRSLRVRLKG